jgi:putative DNA primase/helicase
MRIYDAATSYLGRGWPLVLLRPRAKIPLKPGWKESPIAGGLELEAAVAAAPAEPNLGILTGDRSKLIVLDVDPRSGGDSSLARIQKDHRVLPTTPTVRTGSGGCHFYFLLPDRSDYRGDRTGLPGYPGLDIKCGGLVVAPPSVHPNGERYEWEEGLSPDAVSISECPPWLIELASKRTRLAGAHGYTQGEIEEGARNDTLFRLACGYRAQGFDLARIFALLKVENERATPPLDEDELRSVVHSALRYEPGRGHPLTELGNARRLVALMNGDCRYESLGRKWYCFDETVWRPDLDGQVERIAKRVPQELRRDAENCGDQDLQRKLQSFAKASESRAKIQSSIELAKSEPEIVIRSEQFDRHLTLLNVGNGTIDLESAKLIQHQREHLLTRKIEVDYDPHARCPRFETFLGSIFDGDLELVEYLQKVVGYCLTGLATEQKFWILLGAGANGKSTLLNVLSRLLGDYAAHSPTDTFLEKRAGGPSNDLLRLRGARLVTVSEANPGDSFASGLIKQITGGETVTARALYSEFEEFVPQFKLIFATNHPPRFDGADYALIRRIKPIEFPRVFSQAEQDPNLLAQLLEELPGVLAWAVTGAVNYFRDGLSDPPAVLSAIETYRAANDPVGQFIEEECVLEASAIEPASGLYAQYRAWAKQRGLDELNQTSFGLMLTRKGINATKRSQVYRVGVRLRRMHEYEDAA